MRSYVLTLLYGVGFLYFRNWSGKYIEVARQPDFQVRSALFTDKDEVRPNKDAVAQTINLYAEWSDGNSQAIYYACTEERFGAHLTKLNEDLTLVVINFYAAPQACSYRYKDELNPRNSVAFISQVTAEEIVDYLKRFQLEYRG